MNKKKTMKAEVPAGEVKDQGVKVTIYLPRDMEQRLREKHVARPAPRGHFYGMLVDLIAKGLAAEDADRRR